MGTALSKWYTNDSRSSYQCELDDHLHHVQPEYYVQNVVVTDNDISLAKSSWDIIMSAKETTPFSERLAKKSENAFNYTSVLTWFYDVFYSRFFEICPDAQPLFHSVSMVSQGRLIAGVISSALHSLKDPVKLKEKLTDNTIKHNGKGIKSEWYSKMGEALIWALGHVIGGPFDEPTTLAWQRIYSFMLSIILPLAVEYEVAEKHASSKISSTKTSSSQGSSKHESKSSFFTGSLFRNHLSISPSPSSNAIAFSAIQTKEWSPDAETRAVGSGQAVTGQSGKCPVQVISHDPTPDRTRSGASAPQPEPHGSPVVELDRVIESHQEDMVQSFSYELSTSERCPVETKATSPMPMSSNPTLFESSSKCPVHKSTPVTQGLGSTQDVALRAMKPQHDDHHSTRVEDFK